MITLDTYIISDTHFRHANIVKFCGRDANHDEIMRRNWMETITEEDNVLHLGDLMVWYNDLWVEEAKYIVRGLSGRRAMLRGNHDKMENEEYGRLGFMVIPEFIQEFDGKRVLFSHYPDQSRLDQWDINIHGHIHNSPYNPEQSLSRDYRNVSVEVMDYRPVKLRDILYGGRYMSRKNAGTWDNTQKDRKVVMPTDKELAYYANL